VWVSGYRANHYAYFISPSWMAWSSFDAPDWLRWLGVELGLGVLASVHWVLRNLGRNVSETVLSGFIKRSYILTRVSLTRKP
jgi:hypothetical protein